MEFPQPISFKSPIDSSKYDTILDKETLVHLLHQEPRVPWNIFNSKNKKFVYANCRSCSAKIRHKKRNNVYQLQYIHEWHKHEVNLNLKKLYKSAVSKFIQDIPQNICRQNVVRIVKAKFPQLSINQVSYIYNKHNLSLLNLPQMISKMNQEGFYISMSNTDVSISQDPSYLLIISPQMKTKFFQFGRVISFDITYKIIAYQTLNLRVGIFTGVSSKRKLLPYGYVILNSEKTQVLKMVFSQFFRIMQNRTITVVSDQQRSISSALSELKNENNFFGIHILDKFHILRLIQTKTNNFRLTQASAKLFKCKDKVEFSRQMNEIENKFQGDEVDILLDYLQYKQRFCLAYISQNFIGIGSSSSTSQSINNAIKGCIKRSKRIEMVIFILNRVFLGMFKKQETEKLQIQKMKVQQYFMDDQLYQLRISLHRLNFRLLWENYVQSFQLLIQKQSHYQYKLYKQDEHENSFQVNYFIDIDLFICECQLAAKVGIPCSHLLRLLRKLNIPIKQYVDHFWINKND